MIAGRYSLDHEVGRGGMGSVWLGRDETLGRPVALKRIGLLPGTDGTDLARAEREAQLAARLNHPNVVSVFNYVKDADAHWLVMEYVDGLNLSQLVRDRGALSPDDAAPILAQVADALAAAHEAGIVHRDVKPSNILVDSAGRVKLTDFGIARISADPSLTQTGLVIGTPTYLAPEVISGQRGNDSADVWSLGATLFYALAARPPYDVGENVLSGLYQIVHDEPPRLPEAGWMAPLLEATMAKDPGARWTMAEVRDFLAGGPQQVVEPTVVEREDTSLLGSFGFAVEPAPEPAPQSVPATPRTRRRGPGKVVLAAAAALVVLAVVLVPVLRSALSGDGDGAAKSTAGAGTTASSTPSASASEATSTKKASPSPSPTHATAAGMKTFIRDYVTTVAADPDRAWTMLTPKFQRESGGIEKYRSFWGPAQNGRLISVDADPRSLAVSYQVRFDDFDNGPGPTVLDLVYEGGRYRIDGERTQGFVPAT